MTEFGPVLRVRDTRPNLPSPTTMRGINAHRGAV